MNKLILMRHAKSTWKNDRQPDRERPLSKRGKSDIGKMAAYLRQGDLVPTRVLVSPARRCTDTASRLLEALELAADYMTVDTRLYLADVDTLLQVLQEEAQQSTARLLLIGHNPGLDHLLEFLSAASLERTAKGKLLTTAALAVLDLEHRPLPYARQCAALQALARPKHLED